MNRIAKNDAALARLWFCLAFLVFHNPISASTDYIARAWQMEDGLPHDSVTAIAQTSDGYLWLGTAGGLARFDGVRFVAFSPENTSAFSSYYISTLCAAKDGSLWIGTDREIVQFREGQFTRHPWKAGIETGAIHALLEDRQGTLWIGTDVYLISRRDGKFSYIDLFRDLELTLGTIRTLYEDCTGNLWIGASDRLRLFKDGRCFDYASSSRSELQVTNDSLARFYVAKPNDAEAICVIAPQTVIAGEDFQATVQLKNTGGKMWTNVRTREHHLGSQLPQDNYLWAKSNRVDLATNIYPGEMASFVFTATAPAQAGSYSFAWQMVQEGVGWFGRIVSATIEVIDAKSAQEKSASHFLIVTNWASDVATDDFPAPPTSEKEKHLPQGMVVSAIGEDQEGYFWIGSDDHGLFRLKGRECRQFTTQDGLFDNIITAIRAARDGTVWIGTSKGLNRCFNGELIREKDSRGICHESIYSILEDREGNLWVGTNKGLNQFRPRRFSAYTTTTGLSHDTTLSVCEGRNGELWIGTWGGGLNRMKDGSTTVFTTADGLSSKFILALCEDRDGGLWVSGSGNGVDYLRDGKRTRYGIKDGLPNEAARCIYQDRRGDVWLGTAEGLARFREGKFSTYGKESGLAANMVRSICEDRDDALWIGTQHGISRFKDGQLSPWLTNTVLATNVIVALYVDAENCLWIGTGVAGLHRFKAGKLASYTMRQGLAQNAIYQILEDDAGRLWLGGRSGIFSVSKKELNDFADGRVAAITSYTYGRGDGLVSGQCKSIAQPSCWKTRDGRLLFATASGLAVLEENKISINELPPPVVIEEVIADKKKVTSDRWQVAGKATHHVTRHPSLVTLPPGRGELEFLYTALSLSVPEKNRFQYRLDGVDSEWVDAGTRRMAHYDNLAPGRYEFRVRACNNDGVWNALGENVKFTLLPHFWQTWWFYTLLGLSALGSAAGTARYITKRKMERQLEILERQHALEKERARIAKDIHDDLGASLTQITLLSELAQSDVEKPEEVQAHTQKISTTAREMVQSLDEIVWAVSPKNDTLPSLVEYLARSADEFLENTNIRCWLEMPKDIPPRVIAAEVRHNIFLAFKEALNNAVKYSGASELRVKVTIEPHEFQMTISDNGCGFDPASVSAGGNGLGNMPKRLAEIEGKFELHSRLREGTTILMRVPLR